MTLGLAPCVMRHSWLHGVSLAALIAACADQTIDHPTLPDAPAGEEPVPAPGDRVVDAGADVDGPDAEDRGPKCSSTFGTAITPEHGRLDGVVRAVIVPGDLSCRGDDDHVFVQIDAAGATYVLSINVESKFASSPLVRWHTRSAPLLGPPWSSGWHTSSVGLDYAADLNARSRDFVARTRDELGMLIAARAKPGTKVSAYGDGFASGDGAHKIHRNTSGYDGALVVDPTGSPTYLLFAFADQAF